MLGVIGGAFDPVHYGHLRIALEAQQALGLEQIRWVPTGQPPHRDLAHASTEQRKAMLELALADQPAWSVDTRELEREGPSFMVDTLLSLRQQVGEEQPLVLILGQDAFAGLPSWSRWQQLWSLAHILVCQRPGCQPDLAAELQQASQQREVADVAGLSQSPAGGLYRLEVSQLDIASSQIRSILQAQQSPRYLLPDAVLRYIQDNHLYQGEGP